MPAKYLQNCRKPLSSKCRSRCSECRPVSVRPRSMPGVSASKRQTRERERNWLVCQRSGPRPPFERIKKVKRANRRTVPGLNSRSLSLSHFGRRRRRGSSDSTVLTKVKLCLNFGPPFRWLSLRSRIVSVPELTGPRCLSDLVSDLSDFIE